MNQDGAFQRGELLVSLYGNVIVWSSERGTMIGGRLEKNELVLVLQHREYIECLTRHGHGFVFPDNVTRAP